MMGTTYRRQARYRRSGNFFLQDVDTDIALVIRREEESFRSFVERAETYSREHDYDIEQAEGVEGFPPQIDGWTKRNISLSTPGGFLPGVFYLHALTGHNIMVCRVEPFEKGQVEHRWGIQSSVSETGTVVHEKDVVRATVKTIKAQNVRVFLTEQSG